MEMEDLSLKVKPDRHNLNDDNVSEIYKGWIIKNWNEIGCTENIAY